MGIQNLNFASTFSKLGIFSPKFYGFGRKFSTNRIFFNRLKFGGGKQLLLPLATKPSGGLVTV